MQILFPQQYRASLFQAADNFSVFRGDAIFEQSAGGGGANASGVDQILESEGNAMQRARQSPRRISASAWRACARADSAVTVMKAFSRGFSFSMRARQSSVSSTGEMDPWRNNSLICNGLSCKSFVPRWKHYRPMPRQSHVGTAALGCPVDGEARESCNVTAESEPTAQSTRPAR